jgi:hypothetical protein
MTASRDDGEDFGLDIGALQMQVYGVASTLPIGDVGRPEPSSPESRCRLRRDLPIEPSGEERKRKSGARIIFATWFGVIALCAAYGTSQYVNAYTQACAIADTNGNGLSALERAAMYKEMGMDDGRVWPSGTELDRYLAKYNK